MKVLVTGGCGMIGFHLAKFYKEQGHEVVVMDNLERSLLLNQKVNDKRKNFNKFYLEKIGVECLSSDVSKSGSWDILKNFDRFDADVIFHMAAQCGVPPSVENPIRDFEVNTVGTMNMLEYARKCGSKVVYASTNKTYPIHDAWVLSGDHMSHEPRWEWADPYIQENGWDVEQSQIGSRTPYGNSKYMGDLSCQEWYHMYGVPTGVFRMSCIYGPNQFSFEEQGWITWFAIAALKGIPVNIFGDGKQVRDILFVEDVVKAYDAYVTSDVDHGVWNLGGGPNLTVTLNQTLDFLEKTTGNKINRVYKDWRPSDQKVYTSNISQIKEDLGWEPTVKQKEGIERVVNWVSQNLDVF